MPVITETVEEFVERHGNEKIAIDRGATLLFSDGASMDGIAGRWMTEPPADEYKRLHLIQLYWRTKLEMDEKLFTRKQAELHEQGAMALKYSNVRPPGDGDIKNLERMRDVARASAMGLADINMKIAKSEKGKRQAEDERISAERVQEVQNRLNKINYISLD